MQLNKKSIVLVLWKHKVVSLVKSSAKQIQFKLHLGIFHIIKFIENNNNNNNNTTTNNNNDFIWWGHHLYRSKVDGDLLHDRHTHINTDMSLSAYSLSEKR